MRIAVNLDTGAVTTWLMQSLANTRLKRRDQFPVEVKFHRGGNFEQLPDAATGTLGIKRAAGSENTGFLAFVIGWTRSGTGKDAVYTFALNLNTVAIGEEFTAGIETITARLEIERTAPGLRRSSATLDLIIEDDLIAGDESAPEDGPPNLANWGNDHTRFGETGALELKGDGETWWRVSLAGTPPQITLTQL